MRSGSSHAVVFALTVVLALGACDSAKPLRPTESPPVVVSLSVFPGTIAPGDSALVTCQATDPDGNSLIYFWSSDCRLVRTGALPGYYEYDTRDGRLVVTPGACVHAPADTGWIGCEVSDLKGGSVYAGLVPVIIKQ